MKKRKALPPAEIPQGIQELVWADPRTLDPNPLNWKTHPESQRASLRASLKSNGWAGALLFNRASGKLLDGHGRRDEAIRLGIESVPVLVGDWDEAGERRILQSLDTIGSMYSTDGEKLASLNALVAQDLDKLAFLDEDTKRTIDSFQTRLEALPEAIESGTLSASPLPLTHLSNRREKSVQERQKEVDDAVNRVPETDDASTLRQLVSEDVLFSSSNDWGIPDLDPSKFAPPSLAPEATYNRHPSSVTEKSYFCHSARPFPLRDELAVRGGVYGFFTEDWRFEAAYYEPAQFAQAILDEGWSAVIAPDFSTYAEWPFAMRLWNLYRSRFVARYWQEAGLKVIPILQSVLTPDSSRGLIDIGISTLPKCPVVAVQCQTVVAGGGDFKAFAKWLTGAMDVVQPQVVIIYGGADHQGRFIGHLPKAGKSLRYVMLPTYMASRRKQFEDD